MITTIWHKYIEVRNSVGIGNILKGFITYLSLDEYTKIKDNKTYSLGDYSSILDVKHIFNPAVDEHIYKPAFTWRFLILHSESEQKHIPDNFSTIDLPPNNVFKHDTFIDSNYNRSLICDKVFNRIISAIRKIQWHSDILNEVNKVSCQFKKNVLGVSVRSWTAKHEHNIKRLYNKQTYINTITDVVSNQTNNIHTIFLSVDNPVLYDEYIRDLKNYNVIIYNPPTHFTELQYVCVKLLLLSKCQFLIGNRISTFTEMSFWLSECTQDVITV